MGLDTLKSKLTRAGEDAQAYLVRKWEEKQGRRPYPPGFHPPGGYDPSEAARQEHLRRQAERNAFFSLITAKITGDSRAEMPPLMYDPTTPHKAVFLVTTPISFGKFELSKKAYHLLARHLGMSMNSVSHWLLVVVDRGGFAPCYCYDLMSDQVSLDMLGKSYFRMYELTPDLIQGWSSCYYVGETMRSPHEIQHLGTNLMAINPRYNVLSNNCQDLAENLVKELCNGKIISQGKLKEELSQISPKIARDLLVARLRSRVDSHGESEDSDSVRADLALAKSLF
jgi:hypothetical protein